MWHLSVFILGIVVSQIGTYLGGFNSENDCSRLCLRIQTHGFVDLFFLRNKAYTWCGSEIEEIVLVLN